MWEPWVQDLASDRPERRRVAAERLLQLGTNASSAAVALLRACQDDDEQVRELVSAALEDLGPPPLDSLAELREFCGHRHPDTAYWAVTLIGRLGTRAGMATAELAECLGEDRAGSVRQRAAWALGQIGPAAAGAESVLRDVLRDPDPRLVRLAQQALERIQAGR
jgi:HEAT repeat protein